MRESPGEKKGVSGGTTYGMAAFSGDNYPSN